MVTKNDLLLILTEMEDKGINTTQYKKQLFLNEGVSIETLKFINDNRQLDVAAFYEMLRKNYNTKKSPLYKNIVRDEVSEPEDVLTTLAALNLQILLFAKKLDDNKMFLPDEVFETKEIAQDTIERLIEFYDDNDGIWVFPILLKSGQHIGHIELVPLGEFYEIGYHIGKKYTNKGYASEALKIFLPFIKKIKGLNKLYGICHDKNIASKKVLEKNNFKLEFRGIGCYQGKKQEISRYVIEL